MLIIGTIVILNQVKYIQEKKLGYEKDNVVMFPLDKKTADVYDQLKTEMLRTGGVANVGRASESPVSVMGGYSISIPAADEHGIITQAVATDEGYVPVFGLELVAGTNFTEGDFQKLRKDTIYSFLLNESAIHTLGIPLDQAVGHPVKMNGRKGAIKGVLKDFHFSSLHESIGPLVLFTEEDSWNYFFLRLPAGNPVEHLSSVENVYRTLVPHRPFEYKFINDRYAALYQGEERMGVISLVFAALAIIIACLGLLGLVSFAAMQKTKEISIRKVMGATASGIVFLITRDFTKLILVAVLVAIPSAWYVMQNYWLTGFAYHTTLGVAPFLIATGGCLLIAFLTAAYQAIKAALINPAQTLRSE
jgi:putative ABC transport system permease protein